MMVGEFFSFVRFKLDEFDFLGGYVMEIGGEIVDNVDINGKLGVGILIVLIFMFLVIVF